jgi:hypothetical protein
LTSRSLRALLYGALVLLFVLHQDLWLWDDPRMVLGLPVGLTYHLVYCLAAALLLAFAVRFAWPEGAEASEGQEADR